MEYTYYFVRFVLGGNVPVFCHIRGFGPPRPVRIIFNLLMARLIYFWSNRKN
ncbi:MAG: hypothetical protein K6253_00325 [Candidatus Liberibacter asiaticus]|nr:hypothetical protein [Candidatus Liberibacter asiaticus]